MPLLPQPPFTHSGPLQAPCQGLDTAETKPGLTPACRPPPAL